MIRDAGVLFVGGFQSPMEKECLEILLRGKRQVILCAAKGLVGLRLGQKARQAIRESRMLVLSPFADNICRTTAIQAVQRNDLVAVLSDALLVPYATPGGKTWVTVKAALERNKSVFTFAEESNRDLVQAGVRTFDCLKVGNSKGRCAISVTGDSSHKEF
jgi:predicted Rossmann fold nucleotide-binding protein DprA/Smf involved in DNA uptake